MKLPRPWSKTARASLVIVVSSQMATHSKYGGVVPELASREHLRAIVPAVRRHSKESATGWKI